MIEYSIFHLEGLCACGRISPVSVPRIVNAVVATMTTSSSRGCASGFSDGRARMGLRYVRNLVEAVAFRYYYTGSWKCLRHNGASKSVGEDLKIASLDNVEVCSSSHLHNHY
jgi:hypothetical protein